MAVEELLPPNVVPPPKAAAVSKGNSGDGWTYGLRSIWPVTQGLTDASFLPCRFEGEVESLV